MTLRSKQKTFHHRVTETQRKTEKSFLCDSVVD